MRLFDRNPREEADEALAFFRPPEDDSIPAKEYPHFVVDHHADAAYVYINDLMPDVALTKSITDSINADYDVDGNMIGIEFLSLKINFGEEFRVRRRD
jgi:uncharacterized protein YuzE